MNYQITENGISLSLEDSFDLKNTFDCGQCFRWEEHEDGSYTGIVQGNYAKVISVDGHICIEKCSEDDFLGLWKNYFDLDNNYNDIRKELSELYPSLSCAVDSIDGIRILAQDPWEALCSFIISQNNNIPRIKGIISRLCANFGEKTEYGYTFPSAEKLAVLSPEDLSELRAGFRAKYIIDAAQKVSSKEVDLSSMTDAPIEYCRTELQKIKGVGAKVAECTLLYGLHRLEAFPVDVWMKKAMSTLFSDIDPLSLGRYAGIAQQYIFHYSRLNPEMVKTE